MARKKRKKGSVRVDNYARSILTILKSDKNKSFNYKQIAAKLGVNDASSRNKIIKTLHKLAANQEIEDAVLLFILGFIENVRRYQG